MEIYQVNESKWDSLLKDPLWYVEMWPMINELFVNQPDVVTKEWRNTRTQVLEYFTRKLYVGQIALGDRAEFFNDDDRWTRQDSWKLPIDTAVIHHTHTASDVSLQQLNALGLLRLYVPVYMSKAFMVDDQYQPISSGHYYLGSQTFIGYHYLVRNGAAQRVLDPRYVGFHAGNYPINCRSLGIALVGDYTDTIPPQESIIAVRGILSQWIAITTVVGHCDVKPSTICPGRRWNEWKGLLTE